MSKLMQPILLQSKQAIETFFSQIIGYLGRKLTNKFNNHSYLIVFKGFFIRLMQMLATLLAFSWLMVLLCITILLPLLGLHHPLTEYANYQNLLPDLSREDTQSIFILGTDRLGRDVLARICYGMQNSLVIALLGTIGAYFIGIILSFCHLLYGAMLKNTILSIARFLSILPIILILLLAALWFDSGQEPPIYNLSIILALTLWVPFFNNIGEAINRHIKMPYSEYARLYYASQYAFLRHEILPNCKATISRCFFSCLAFALSLQIMLSFFLSRADSQQLDWGSLLAEGMMMNIDNWWVMILPFIALLLTLLALWYLGKIWVRRYQHV